MEAVNSSTPVFTVGQNIQSSEGIAGAARILRDGGLVAFPTETVYGLGANINSEEAVGRIFEVKGREFNQPLTFHLSSPREMEFWVEEVPETAQVLRDCFLPGPMTIVLRRSQRIPDLAVGGSHKVGFRVPRNDVAQAFLRETGVTVVATSANLSGHPSPTRAGHVLDDLSGKIDALLECDEDLLGIESTVVDCTQTPPRILRPGFITQEEIVRIAGFEVLMSDDNLSTARFARFAPAVRMVLVEGEPEKVVARIRELLGELGPPENVGLLVSHETQARIGVLPHMMDMGARNAFQHISHNLFRQMRELEKEGVEIILVEGIPKRGLGATIMNRLIRLADQVVHAF